MNKLPPTEIYDGMAETPVQKRVRLEAARLNVDLWRNNSGVLKNDEGIPVRYGLCNDSAKLNERIKSSDLIGITPIMITPDMVGQVVGVFTAVECKKAGWKFSESDKRAVAQSRFHDIVRRAGGFAGFACDLDELRRILRR